MTIKELIEQLQAYPGDAEVGIYDDDSEGVDEITGLFEVPEENRVLIMY